MGFQDQGKQRCVGVSIRPGVGEAQERGQKTKGPDWGFVLKSCQHYLACLPGATELGGGVHGAREREG